MSIPVTITLNTIVGTPGPFSLYSCIESTCSGSLTPFVTGVSLSDLQTGSLVPDGKYIKIVSTGTCSYEKTILISGIPTATPTPTPTVTPTPTSTIGEEIPTGAYLTIDDDTTYSTDSNTNCNGAYNYTGQITVTLRNSAGTPINTPTDIIVSFDISNASCIYVATYQDTVTITTGSSFGTQTYNSYGHEICPYDSNCSSYTNTWSYYTNNSGLTVGV
jgi:hypothetical protein